DRAPAPAESTCAASADKESSRSVMSRSSVLLFWSNFHASAPIESYTIGVPCTLAILGLLISLGRANRSIAPLSRDTRISSNAPPSWFSSIERPPLLLRKPPKYANFSLTTTSWDEHEGWDTGNASKGQDADSFRVALSTMNNVVLLESVSRDTTPIFFFRSTINGSVPKL